MCRRCRRGLVRAGVSGSGCKGGGEGGERRHVLRRRVCHGVLTAHDGGMGFKKAVCDARRPVLGPSDVCCKEEPAKRVSAAGGIPPRARRRRRRRRRWRRWRRRRHGDGQGWCAAGRRGAGAGARRAAEAHVLRRYAVQPRARGGWRRTGPGGGKPARERQISAGHVRLSQRLLRPTRCCFRQREGERGRGNGGNKTGSTAHGHLCGA